MGSVLVGVAWSGLGGRWDGFLPPPAPLLGLALLTISQGRTRGLLAWGGRLRSLRIFGRSLAVEWAPPVA